MSKRAAASVLALLLASPGLRAAEPQPYVQFPDARLERGRALWLANCETCHGYGVAGAPIPMEPSDWIGRVAQERAVLYRRAIEGYFGPDDTYMPPRGGNDELDDEQVRAAVDYVVALARHYIQRQQRKRE